MIWGPSGEGLGRQEAEAANLTKARVSKDWGKGGGGVFGAQWGGGTRGVAINSGGLEPKFLQARSKSCEAKEC